MTYEGRAVYNLLQMNLKQNPSLDVKPWQVEDYREMSIENLFDRLEKHQIFLDKEHLLLYVDECDSPEDLTDCLYLGEDYTKHEQIFLCVFEIWRRLAPHKQSLSIFVDQFDHLIENYEEGRLETEEELQSAIESFQMILDDNVDEGGTPQDGYYFFSSYSCHDLETFIYEYISHQIDVGNDLYASGLVDGFFPYISNKKWFELLRIRLVYSADIKEANYMIERFTESIKKSSDISLLFETLHFLAFIGENKQFIKIFDVVSLQIKTDKDLYDLLLVTLEFFESTNKHKEIEIVKNLVDIQKEKDLKSGAKFDETIFKNLKNLIELSYV